jgi:carbamoyltransferase
MIVLGISAFYHDSAAALVRDGDIIAAAQEERFSRRKHDSRFPQNAVRYCLQEAGIGFNSVDFVAFYDKPLLKFDRLLETYLAFAPRGFRSFHAGFPIWLREKVFLKELIRRELAGLAADYQWDHRLLFSEHHLSHAASAFYPSPFESALVLTMDGVGEWATTSIAVGEGSNLAIRREIHFPHSLGLLYSAFTYYAGFKVNSGEYKLMGLAPYGRPVYAQLIYDHLIDLKLDGSYRLNLRYFDYCTGLTMTNEAFHGLFGGPPRSPDAPIAQRHMDIAASIQSVTDETVLRITRALRRDYGNNNLCLAGGVALNCVANGKILRDGRFRQIWIQPAAGDAGGALGAALAAYHGFAGQTRVVKATGDGMKGSYLGPGFNQLDIETRLSNAGGRFKVLDEETLLRACAQYLAQERVLGWFQGRMEFGPRALGARSILGDARSPNMQRLLNLKIKRRESFRPFAPSVLMEHVSEWFELDRDSPYMLLVADVAASRRCRVDEQDQSRLGIDKLNVRRSEIPAATHVDYSARVQTVRRETNPRYYDLLRQFEKITGCPVIVNTSFNVRGEPIVCTPEEAFRCFMGTEMDVLAVGNCFLKKEEQSGDLRVEYSDRIDPD